MPEPGKGEEGTEQQFEENAPAPLDYYDRVDTSKAEKIAGVGGEKSREVGAELSKFQRYMQRAREELSQAKATRERAAEWVGRTKARMELLEQKYPKTYQTVRTVGSIARGKTLIGRIGPDIINVPESYREIAGKEFEGIDQFIEQAKLTRGQEEEIAKGKSYVERAAAARSKEVRSLERQQAFIERGYESKYSVIAESWDKQEKPGLWADIQRASGDSREIGKRIEELKFEQLEEVVAKHGGNNSAITQKLEQAKHIAAEYENSLMHGTSGEKYHYFLDKVQSRLGKDYFDLHQHPQRAIAFDRAAANQLYADGFSKQEVAKAIKEGPFYCSMFMKEFEREGVKGEILSPTFDRPAQQYELKTHSHFSEVTERMREKTLDWQANKGQPIQQRKLNQNEFGRYQVLREQAAEYAIDRKLAIEYEALQTLQQYWYEGAHVNDSTTRTQFLLEHGRMVMDEGRASSYQLAYRLHAAGHFEKEIVATLKELAPEVNNSNNLAQSTYRQMLNVTARSPERTAEMEAIKAFKTENNLHAEQRLDRLPISRGVTEERSTKGGTYTDEPKAGTLSRSQSMEEYEPER
jgi:hypothetical protein